MANPYSLFSVDAKYSALIEQIEAAGGEVTPEQEAELDRLTALQVQKADWFAQALDLMESGEEQIDLWIKRFQAKKAAIQRERERWQAAMMAHMESMGVDYIDGELTKVRIMESKSVNVLDTGRLPEQYRRTKVIVEADKKALLPALKSGEQIDGAELVITKYLRTW